MLTMIVGLVLFLGTHSIRLVAEDWRHRQISQHGENLWMAIYTIISIAGLVLIVNGYGETRLAPHVIWLPPHWLKQTMAILLLPTFVLLAAAYIPGSKIKAVTGHPMVASVKLWAFAHLLANGNLADMLLFGSFTLWAIVDYRNLRRRDKNAGRHYAVVGISRDITAISVGLVVWLAFVFFLHEWLFAVKPLTW
jgi:uncharacterized membrane protein